MQIIAKMTRDYIPKTIMYHIVQNVCERFFFFCILVFIIIYFSYKHLQQKSYQHIFMLFLIRQECLTVNYVSICYIQKSLLKESEEERQRREAKLAEFEAVKNVCCNDELPDDSFNGNPSGFDIMIKTPCFLVQDYKFLMTPGQNLYIDLDMELIDNLNRGNSANWRTT